MRRILLIVAMLLVATPAMASVTIKARHLPKAYNGPPTIEATCCAVEVNFTSDSNGQVRAFALDINVDSNFIIRAIRDFQSGPTIQKSPNIRGYGIFPGSFRDVVDPNNPLWTDPNYNPVAPAKDADANHQGLGTSGITVELGSLYYPDTNKPDQNGVLFRIEVIPTKFGAAKGNVHLAVNNARGGVVDADGYSFVKDTNLFLMDTEVNYPKCFPCWTPYGAAAGSQYAEWLAVFEPNCWCGEVYTNWRTQCKGDADGKKETFSNFRVYKSDYAKLASGWAKTATQLRADPNGICADFDHKKETFSNFRVYKSDYARLAAGWAKTETQLKPWCPVP